MLVAATNMHIWPIADEVGEIILFLALKMRLHGATLSSPKPIISRFPPLSTAWVPIFEAQIYSYFPIRHLTATGGSYNICRVTP
jgi:hypothetical protein